MKNVLVIIDMQNDFIDGTLGNPDGNNVVENVIKEIESKNYDYVLLSRDTHFDNYEETLEGQNLPVKHCLYETKGWEIKESIMEALIASKLPYKIFDKKTFGSFAIAKELACFEHELQSVTICGLDSDICVISNALIIRAELPDIKINYVAKACAGSSIEAHDAALKVMNSCQIYAKEN